jgi:hypothetical protein
MSYILVNPIIESSAIKSKKKSSNDAAEDLWSKYSSNIKNHAPEFYFSFLESGSKKIHHYKVNETLENNKVKYSLKKYKNKNINDKEFVKALLKQDGGNHRKHKHKDEDDSSSSSSSDDNSTFHSRKPPRYGGPLAVTYYPNIYGVPNILLPPLVSTYSYVLGGTSLGSSLLGLYPALSKGHYEWKPDP